MSRGKQSTLLESYPCSPCAKRVDREEEAREMLAELRREDGGSRYGDTSGAGAAGHDGSCENSSTCGKHCAV